MARISLRDLNLRFGDVAAVDGVNLEIEDGEFVVFLGPSGCGKTTTLRCIAGLEEATSGDILFATCSIPLTATSKWSSSSSHSIRT